MERPRSSTSSSSTLRLGDFRWPAGALAAIALVIGAEIAVRAAAPWLGEPVLWGGGEAPAKIAVAEKRAAAGGASLLILGPSHASLGISPEAMLGTPGFDLTPYNGALNGRMYPVLEFVYRHVYRSALHPRVAVLSVSPLIFNRYNARMERNSEEFFEAALPSILLEPETLGNRWRRFLLDHVYLYRMRNRQPGLSEGRIPGGKRLDAYGYRSADGVWDDDGRRLLASPAHPYQQIMRRFEFGGRSVEAFERLVAELRGDGVRVIVLNMPFRPELLRISPTGQEDYARYLEAMAAAQARLNFEWLDYEADLPLGDSDFRDVDHLNRQGAEKLSRRLAQDLVRILPGSDGRTDTAPQ